MAPTNRGVIFATALFMGLGGSIAAASADCATDIQAIEAALESGQVDAALSENAKTMLEDAKKLQGEGNEDECTALTAQIKASLGLE